MEHITLEPLTFTPNAAPEGELRLWMGADGNIYQRLGSGAVAAFLSALSPKLTTYIGTKIYRALLTQGGTAAPVATVLENTLGGTVVWTRVSAGVYAATLAAAFPTGKTFPFPAPENATFTAMSLNAPNAVNLSTTDDSGTPADDLLSARPIEIIVYP